MNVIQGKPTLTRYVKNEVHLSAKDASPKKAQHYVTYFRVSTSKQGESGLGLAAQEEAVTQFLASRPHKVISRYTEVESGKKNDRPELLRALDECRKHRVTLLIAKLDRLARNVHFISGLMEAGVEFVAVDNPHASKLMVHLLAAFAEHEREVIAARTRAALQAAKARGVVLGAHGKALAAQHRAEARKRDEQYHPVIAALMRETKSYTRVAERMNAMGVLTPSGGRWYASSVRNVCMRAL